jgi:hypothetical protein
MPRGPNTWVCTGCSTELRGTWGLIPLLLILGSATRRRHFSVDSLRARLMSLIYRWVTHSSATNRLEYFQLFRLPEVINSHRAHRLYL